MNEETVRAAAQRDLDSLKAQLEEAEREFVAHAAAESELAVAAYTSGDKAAKTALGEWQKKLSEIKNRRRQLALAIPIAARKVSEAEARIVARQQIADATARLAVLHEITEHADRLDKLLADVGAEYLALRESTIRCGLYNMGSIEASKRCIQTALLPIGLHSQALPHAHRIKFGTLANGWRGRIKAECDKVITEGRAVLGEAPAKKMEAA